MSNLITHTARLVPYLKRPKQVPSFVTAYFYEPLADEPGAVLGNLYVVIEVLVSGRASEETADLIIETVGDVYYNHPHDSDNPLNRFEAAIKAVNQGLGEHVNRGNAAWIGKLSAVIAIQANDELHVSGTGSGEAYLYRGTAATHITADGPVRSAVPTKTFGSIATGQLEADDRLLLATPALIHQVPLARLQSVITSSGPNAAIAEITNLLHGATTDRIAALVIHATTPELAALQTRSEHPSEIQLGAAETILDVAKLTATPIAQSTLASAKRVAGLAGTGWRRAKPRAQATGFAVAGKLRAILSTKRGRRGALIILAAGLVIIIGLAWINSRSRAAADTFARYQAVYALTQTAQLHLDQNDKAAAQTGFSQARDKLSTLKPQERTINQQLGHLALPEGEPRTFVALVTLVNNQLDVIGGFIRTNATTVATLAARNAKPTHFELVSGKAYVIDAGNHNTINIINLASGAISQSSVDTTKLGNVVSTTVSYTSDGIFILTDKPSVWFYRFDADSLTEQTVAYGGWPAASAIGSYLTNIYLLDNGQVYKHVKNATGYSPKTAYFAAPPAQLAGATALAVDGSVYTIGPTGLSRSVSGVFKQLATAPESLRSASSLRSVGDGSVIISSSPASGRIGLWTATDTLLTYNKQIAINNSTKLYDATFDAKAGIIYATVDNKLVRFNIKL